MLSASDVTALTAVEAMLVTPEDAEEYPALPTEVAEATPIAGKRILIMFGIWKGG